MGHLLKQQEIFQMFDNAQLIEVVEALKAITAYKNNCHSSKSNWIKLAEKLLDSQLGLIDEQVFTEDEVALIRDSSHNNHTMVEILGILGVTEQFKCILNQQLQIYMALLECYPIFYTQYKKALNCGDRLEPELELSNLKIKLLIDKEFKYIALVEVYDKHLTTHDLLRFNTGTALDLETVNVMTKVELEKQLKSLSACQVKIDYVSDQYRLLPSIIISPTEKNAYTTHEILALITFLTLNKAQLTVINPEDLMPEAKKIARKYLVSLSQDDSEKQLISAMLKGLSMDNELQLFTQISTPATQTFFRPLLQQRKPEHYKPADNLYL